MNYYQCQDCKHVFTEEELQHDDYLKENCPDCEEESLGRHSASLDRIIYEEQTGRWYNARTHQMITCSDAEAGESHPATIIQDRQIIFTDIWYKVLVCRQCQYSHSCNFMR